MAETMDMVDSDLKRLYREYLILQLLNDYPLTITSVTRRVAAQDESRTLVQRNDWRTGLILFNDGPNDVLVRWGDEPAAADEFSFRLSAQATYEIHTRREVPSEALTATAEGGDATLLVTEWTLDTSGLPSIRQIRRAVPPSSL